MGSMTHTLIATGLLFVFYCAGVYFGRKSGWIEGNVNGIVTTLEYLDQDHIDEIVEKINAKN